MRKQLLKRFGGRLERLERTQRRAEALFARGQLLRTDMEAIYEGLFLRAVTAFEAFLEEYFYLVVDKKAAFPKSSRTGCRLVANSAELENIILRSAKKKYIDWLPYEYTKERAQTFLHGGRPFTTLGQPHLSSLDRSVAVRHAIAHSSWHAKHRFKTTVIQNLVLRPDERTPAGFLRSVAIYPDTRRFNVVLGQIRAAAIELVS